MKTITLHIWKAKLTAGSPGHAAIEVGGEYFSFYPGDKNQPFKLKSKIEDTSYFKGREHVELKFNTLNSEKALEKIAAIKMGANSYNARFSNCVQQSLAILNYAGLEKLTVEDARSKLPDFTEFDDDIPGSAFLAYQRVTASEQYKLKHDWIPASLFNNMAVLQKRDAEIYGNSSDQAAFSLSAEKLKEYKSLQQSCSRSIPLENNSLLSFAFQESKHSEAFLKLISSGVLTSGDIQAFDFDNLTESQRQQLVIAEWAFAIQDDNVQLPKTFTSAQREAVVRQNIALRSKASDLYAEIEKRQGVVEEVIPGLTALKSIYIKFFKTESASEGLRQALPAEIINKIFPDGAISLDFAAGLITSKLTPDAKNQLIAHIARSAIKHSNEATTLSEKILSAVDQLKKTALNSDAATKKILQAQAEQLEGLEAVLVSVADSQAISTKRLAELENEFAKFGLEMNGAQLKLSSKLDKLTRKVSDIEEQLAEAKNERERQAKKVEKEQLYNAIADCWQHIATLGSLMADSRVAQRNWTRFGKLASCGTRIAQQIDKLGALRNASFPACFTPTMAFVSIGLQIFSILANAETKSPQEIIYEKLQEMQKQLDSIHRDIYQNQVEIFKNREVILDGIGKLSSQVSSINKLFQFGNKAVHQELKVIHQEIKDGFGEVKLRLDAQDIDSVLSVFDAFYSHAFAPNIYPIEEISMRMEAFKNKALRATSDILSGHFLKVEGGYHLYGRDIARYASQLSDPRARLKLPHIAGFVHDVLLNEKDASGSQFKFSGLTLPLKKTEKACQQQKLVYTPFWSRLLFQYLYILEKVAPRFSQYPARSAAVMACVNEIATRLSYNTQFVRSIAERRESIFGYYLDEYNKGYRQLQVLFDESLRVLRSANQTDSRIQYAEYVGYENAENRFQNLSQIVDRLSPVLLSSAPSFDGRQYTAREWLDQLFQTIDASRGMCLLLAQLAWTKENKLYQKLERQLLDSTALLADNKFKRFVDYVKIVSPGGRKGHFVPGISDNNSEADSSDQQTLFFVERVKIPSKTFSHANPFMFNIKVSQYNFEARQWVDRINQLDNPFRHFSSVGPLSACPQIIIPHYLFARFKGSFYHLNTENPAAENIYRYRVTVKDGAPVLSLMKQAVVTSGRKVKFNNLGWRTDLATCSVVFDYSDASLPINTAFYARNYLITEATFPDYKEKALTSSITDIEGQGADSSAMLSMGVYFEALPKLFPNAYNLNAQPGWLSFKALNSRYTEAFVNNDVIFKASGMSLNLKNGFEDLNGVENTASNRILFTYATSSLPDRTDKINDLKQEVSRFSLYPDSQFYQDSERLIIAADTFLDSFQHIKRNNKFNVSDVIKVCQEIFAHFKPLFDRRLADSITFLSNEAGLNDKKRLQQLRLALKRTGRFLEGLQIGFKTDYELINGAKISNEDLADTVEELVDLSSSMQVRFDALSKDVLNMIGDSKNPIEVVNKEILQKILKILVALSQQKLSELSFSQQLDQLSESIHQLQPGNIRPYWKSAKTKSWRAALKRMRADQYSNFFPSAKKVFASKRQAFYTLGDGNCAFNAVAIGVARLVEANKLPAEAARLLKEKLGVNVSLTTWVQDNLDATYRVIQRALAPILRGIAYKQIMDHYESHYKDQYQSGLASAYYMFLAGGRDDTFIVHSFIEAAFKQAKMTCASDDEAITHLLSWWNETGRGVYFAKMKTPQGQSQERWGSHGEIAAIAEYLGINITYIANGYRSKEGAANGFLPVDYGTPSIQDNLIRRGILTKRHDQLCFYQNDHISNQFAAVEESALLLQRLSTFDAAAGVRIPIEAWLSVVSSEKRPRIADMLTKREAVIKHAATGRLCLLYDQDPENPEFCQLKVDAIKAVISAVPVSIQNELLAAYIPNPPAFSVRLDGMHWSFVSDNASQQASANKPMASCSS